MKKQIASIITCPSCGASISDDFPQSLCPKCLLVGVATGLTRANAVTRTSAATAPMMEELSPHFPELDFVELLGVGGMGAVYKAHQKKLDRVVAVKVLSLSLAEDPAFAERFDREARVLARLHHSNIVTVFDCGTAGPYCYLLMEFVDGVNLRQAMQTGGFTPDEALAVMAAACEGLKFAHEQGVLHRDIKPENILMDSRGQVKIADFGIAKLLGESERGCVTLTRHGAVLGSPHYMAPEQIESPGDVDERADIYSLGVVLYEILTGELPLGRFAPPSSKSVVDEYVDEMVMRTLEKDRQARFQTVLEFQTEIERITGSNKINGPFRRVAKISQETARHATSSLVLAGLSVLLSGVAVSGYFVVKPLAQEAVNVGSAPDIVAGVFPILAAMAMLVVGIPSVLGILLGVKVLKEIRDTRGRKRGVGSAMGGVLTMPMLILIVLIGYSVQFVSRLTGSELHPVVVVGVALAASIPITMSLIRIIHRWIALDGKTKGVIA